MTTIEEGLLAYLKTVAGITTIVDTRIYHLRRIQAVQLPCITFQRISTRRLPTHDHSGAHGTAVVRIQFDAQATLYATAKSITDALRAALDGYQGTMGGVEVQSCLVDSELPEFDPADEVITSRSDYVIWHIE